VVRLLKSVPGALIDLPPSIDLSLMTRVAIWTPDVRLRLFLLRKAGPDSSTTIPLRVLRTLRVVAQAAQPSVVPVSFNHSLHPVVKRLTNPCSGYTEALFVCKTLKRRVATDRYSSRSSSFGHESWERKMRPVSECRMTIRDQGPVRRPEFGVSKGSRKVNEGKSVKYRTGRLR